MISLKGLILPPNRHFRVVLMGRRVTGLEVRCYVFLPITGRANSVPTRIYFLCDLPFWL